MSTRLITYYFSENGGNYLFLEPTNTRNTHDNKHHKPKETAASTDKTPPQTDNGSQI